jgi:hypothetical protein
VLDALPQHQHQEQSEDALKDYKLFAENEKVRQATQAELLRLMREGRWARFYPFSEKRWEK